MLPTAMPPAWTFRIEHCQTKRGAKKDTGFYASVLQEAVQNTTDADMCFRGRLQPRRNPWRRLVYLYCYFMWIHLALHIGREEEWSLVGNGNIPGTWNGVSDATWYAEVVPVAEAFAANLNEVRDEDRYDQYNHAPFFDTMYTSVVDTLPIYVTEPTRWAEATLLYAHKYKRCIPHKSISQHCPYLCPLPP